MGASDVQPWKHIVSHGDRNAVYDMRERTILVTSSLCALPIDNPQMRPIPSVRHGDTISLRLLTTHIRIDSDTDLAIKLVSDAYKRWYCVNHAIIVDENAELCALEVIETLGKLGCANIDHFSTRKLESSISNWRPIEPTSDGDALLAWASHVSKHRVTIESLCVDPELFRLLHFGSIDRGSLFVSVHHGHYEASAGPILSPHSQDRCISDSLEGIISQECVSRVWQARPSTVTGCKSCLVRFACRNSRVFRKLGEDVWSPPVNCEILTEHALEA